MSFESTRSGTLARAAGTVMAAFLLSRALGLAREVVIGATFGTSRELDAYLAAFRVPDLLFQIIAGGALASAFLPVFSERLIDGRTRAAWRLGSAVANLVLLATLAAAGLAAASAPMLIRELIAPGFEPAAQVLAADLMRLMLASTAIFAVSGLAMAALNAHGDFLVPALAPAIYNLAIIGGAVFLSPAWGIYGLAVGVVVGAAAHLLIQMPLLVRRGMTYRPILGLGDPAVRTVGRLMAPRALGLAGVQLNFMVNTILASGLAPGSLAALNYAWLLMLLPQGIVAQGVATAAFPALSRLAARADRIGLRRTLALSLRMVWFLTLPASAGLLILREPLVRLLLERGEFGADSTQAVAYALQFFAVGLVAHATVEILARAFYALQDTRTPVAVGIAGVALNIVLSVSLVGPLGHGGLALANTLATWMEMVALVVLLSRKFDGLPVGELSASGARLVLATGAMGAALAVFRSVSGPNPVAVIAGGGIFLGAVVYLGIAAFLNSRELWAWLRRSREAEGL
ncbi:MAG: murein biosynthesis integral membrane protein MurJ [Anaerolineae bacterium]